MKTVKKIYSNVKDVAKYHFYYITPEDGELIQVNDYPEDAAIEICGWIPEKPEKNEPPLWMPRLLKSIDEGLAYLAEEFGDAIHKDLEDIWKRLDALEERMKKS